MKHIKQILICGAFVILALLAWVVSINRKTDAERQLESLEIAKLYLEDEVYIRAIPHLETASSYDDVYTAEAESLLKKSYLQLSSDYSYESKYRRLLEKQLEREDCPAEIFLEAANYYLAKNHYDYTFETLHSGIDRTADAALTEMYEGLRYQYDLDSRLYGDVTLTNYGAIQVQDEATGLWGVANMNGSLVIPCEYDKVSSYSPESDQFIVLKNGVVSAINSDNFRVALCHDKVQDFSNFAQNRLCLKTAEGWRLVDANFNKSETVLQEIGLYNDGYAPAKLNGKWGLIDRNGESWLIAPEYDDVARDELGKGFDMGAAFLKQNGKYSLCNCNGNEPVILDGKYDDARPFTDGYAAVKQGGLWGFVDVDGTMVLPCKYADARSFSFGLAAVKVGDKWGYIDPEGKLVIEAVFEEARDFCKGGAPVRTEAGWRFITLIEFE